MFHAMSQEEVLEFWDVDPDGGLAPWEVRERREHFGANRLPSRDRPHLLKLLVKQWDDFMVLVLLGATAVAYFLGEYTDAIVILSIVTLNGLLGFLQEYRAEAALLSLQKMSALRTRVRRDGKVRTVDSEDLVPGDILELGPGDRVPADCRLIGTGEGACDESVLTGESIPVPKEQVIVERSAQLTDRSNILHHGTGVVAGKLTAVVVATGTDSELGTIALMLGETAEPDRPPLQRNLQRLGQVLLVGCLVVSALVAVLGVMRGKPAYDMFFAGVSLAVAAIPEGLPAVVTIALAMGVQRMARRNAVVRNLRAVETLGCATVICSDKTGTLTENRLKLEVVSVDGHGWRLAEDVNTGQREGFWRCLLYAAWCCDIEPERWDEQDATGDPTELALVEAARSLMHARLRSVSFKRLGQVPFSSARRRMSVWGIRTEDGEQMPTLIVKGAPETLLKRSEHAWSLAFGREQRLTDRQRRRLLRKAEDLSRHGYRVLAVGQKALCKHRLEEGVTEDEEQGLCLMGFVALLDPPRPECTEALKECHAAGVRALMITGDHPLTARAVAMRLGMVDSEEATVVTGDVLQEAEDRELAQLVQSHSVFARVTPEQKLRIVEALRDLGHVVVMTGDGVNDAPALQKAHIGVAMGITGTDVTRDASDIILTDDNFATIVEAIREGRGVFRNLRKFVSYLLSCNVGEILLMLFATLANLPHPLIPSQILLVNLVTDGLPAIALGMEPADSSLMYRPPRDIREGVLSGGLGTRIMIRGLVMGLLVLTTFAVFWLGGGDLAHARTVAFVTLVMSQLIHAYETRWADGTLKSAAVNLWLPVAVTSSFAVMVAAVYCAPLASALRMVPLEGGTLIICGLVALVGPVADRLLRGLAGEWLGVTTLSW